MSLGEEYRTECIIREAAYEHTKKPSEINIVGIQAEAKKNFATFQTLRPQGMVDLIAEPDNEYDPFCVRVEWHGVKLGYLPANKKDGKYVGSDIQKAVLEQGLTTAQVKDYAYMDRDEVFNNDHRGRLGSVTLALTKIDNDTGKALGAKYMRVTSFLKYFDPYGGGDGLIKWAYEQADTYEGYKEALNQTAEGGTALHAQIEAYLRKETKLESLPDNVQRFFEKFEISPCYMEQRFYDNTLGVSGQPDLVAYVDGVLTVVDWKSSKKPSTKHKLQTSIYAMNAQWDGEKPQQGMVVAFGSENKQGFSVATVKRSQIETNYVAMQHIKKAMDLCGVWIPEDKYYAEGEL